MTQSAAEKLRKLSVVTRRERRIGLLLQAGGSEWRRYSPQTAPESSTFTRSGKIPADPIQAPTIADRGDSEGRRLKQNFQ